MSHMAMGERRRTGEAQAAQAKSARLNEAFLPNQWFVEFEQAYDDGVRVVKRALEASKPVIQKYDLAADEVVAFTTHEEGKRAMTAFHFHPEFPVEDRDAYMRANEEGLTLVCKVIRHLTVERAKDRAKLKEKALSKARAVGGVMSMAGAFLKAEGRRNT